MVSNKIIAVLAATSALALFAATSANAESIVKEEQEQLGNSAAPDVDPGASQGPTSRSSRRSACSSANRPARTFPSVP
jgi:hypothetical protein